MVKKYLKKFVSAVVALSLSCSIMSGLNGITIHAAGVLTESETSSFHNDDLDNAQFVSTNSILKKTLYSYISGGFYGEDDVLDCYEFSTSKTTGSEGRFAIKMEGIPSGHNYDLYLLDQNGDVIAASTRASNRNEIVKITEKASSYTTLYVVVQPVSVPDYEKSSYRLIFDEYIATGTKKLSFSPTQITTTSGTWSSDVSASGTSIPSNALITSATISASKSTVVNGIGYQLHARVGSGAYTRVNWSSGDIALPELVGQNASGTYFAGFTATEIKVKIGSRYEYLGFMSMKSFKMTVNYEYDKLSTY